MDQMHYDVESNEDENVNQIALQRWSPRIAPCDTSVASMLRQVEGLEQLERYSLVWYTNRSEVPTWRGCSGNGGGVSQSKRAVGCLGEAVDVAEQ